MKACPDSHPDDFEGRDCWTELEMPQGMSVDDWLKSEIKDGLEHELMHAVTGPAIYGCEEDGTPRFEVFRDETNQWSIRSKPDYSCAPRPRGMQMSEQRDPAVFGGKWADRDLFALDADVTVYWPDVRPCYDAAPVKPRTHTDTESGETHE